MSSSPNNLGPRVATYHGSLLTYLAAASGRTRSVPLMASLGASLWSVIREAPLQTVVMGS